MNLACEANWCLFCTGRLLRFARTALRDRPNCATCTASQSMTQITGRKNAHVTTGPHEICFSSAYGDGAEKKAPVVSLLWLASRGI